MVTFLPVIAAGSARSFDYPEHEAITREATRILREREPGQTVLKEALTALASHLGATYAEQVDGFIDHNVTALPMRFTWSDIPALAGDHAAAPDDLVWRIFDTSVSPRPQDSFGLSAVRLAFNLGKGSDPPETGLTRRPDRQALLAYVRTLRGTYPEKPLAGTGWSDTGRWPIALEQRSAMDEALMALDDTYGQLGVRASSHFRFPGDAAFIGQRRCYRVVVERNGVKTALDRCAPALHGLAYYADLHTGAIAFARAARVSQGDRRATYLAVAMLLEGQALHYLQDGVSAGHLPSDAFDLNNGSRHAYHEHFGLNGLGVEREELETLIGKYSSPGSICAKGFEGAHLEIYGDGSLQSLSFEARATWCWATRITAMSIDEVIGEVESTKPRAGGDEFDAFVSEVIGCEDQPHEELFDFTSVSSPTPIGSNDLRRVYRCLYRWWEGDVRVGVDRPHVTEDDATPSRLRGTPMPDTRHRGLIEGLLKRNGLAWARLPKVTAAEHSNLEHIGTLGCGDLERASGFGAMMGHYFGIIDDRVSLRTRIAAAVVPPAAKFPVRFGLAAEWGMNYAGVGHFDWALALMVRYQIAGGRFFVGTAVGGGADDRWRARGTLRFELGWAMVDDDDALFEIGGFTDLLLPASPPVLGLSVSVFAP